MIQLHAAVNQTASFNPVVRFVFEWDTFQPLIKKMNLHNIRFSSGEHIKGKTVRKNTTGVQSIQLTALCVWLNSTHFMSHF